MWCDDAHLLPPLLADIPSPYANENAARYANNGALPPDLSLMTKARHSGDNYLFALLTGYRPVPYGLQIREGTHATVIARVELDPCES